mgnify:CR=1 FL=1
MRFVRTYMEWNEVSTYIYGMKWGFYVHIWNEMRFLRTHMEWNEVSTYIYGMKWGFYVQNVVS